MAEQNSTESTPSAAERRTGALPVGMAFGRYRIERLLGEGGMGAVYLAKDAGLNRSVALKIPKFEPGDEDMQKRFLREARTAAALRHANICPVYDVGEIDGVLYLTMAYIEGRPLSAWCREGKLLSPRQAAVLVRKLALALAAAHGAGIVHRDLKPENVMVDRTGEPIVMDFGLARTFEDTDARLTRTGTILGSPAYMSPEQVQAKAGAVGPASDVYSLGVVFYELLAGRVPFDGAVGVVMAKVLTKAAPSPRKFRPGLDEGLEAICLKMMAKKAGDRYAGMNEAARALAAWIERQPEPAGSRTGLQGSAAADDPSAAPRTTRNEVQPAAMTTDTTNGKTENEGKSSGLLVKAVAGVFATVIAPVAVAFGIKYSEIIVASLTGKPEAPKESSQPDKTASSAPDGPFEYREAGPTVRLFNQSDRTGFYTSLQRTKADKKPPGKNKDPDKVFTVKNGVLRISGETAGALITEKQYANYHLTVEYKWGVLLKEEKLRSGGILLHCVGPDGAHQGSLPRSIRCKVTERAAGHLACLSADSEHPARLTAAMTLRSTTGSAGPHYEHHPGELTTISDGTLCRFTDVGNEAELPGEWNRIECVCLGDRIMVLLNGQVVNSAIGLVPSSGKIAVQSHQAELFIRKIELQPIARK